MTTATSIEASHCGVLPREDLNLGPHPYQAHSRDAFKQQERKTPAQRSDGSDRGWANPTATTACSQCSTAASHLSAL